MAKLRPINNKLVVKRTEAESKTPSGIVIPDSAKEKPRRGKVVAVPKNVENDEVKVGDEVIFATYAGNDIEVDGEKLLLLDLDEVHAVVEA
jgi:chaperonin GroES